MACDYFIDALKDPNFALKVRERFPKDLDTALRVALQLEVWSKDVDQSKIACRGQRCQRQLTSLTVTVMPACQSPVLVRYLTGP